MIRVLESNEDTFIWDGINVNDIPNNVVNLVIEDGVEVICDVFFPYTKLKSVVLPDTIYVIKNDAFNGCKNLESIKLSKNLETIGDRVFTNCKKLKSIDIPDIVSEIGRHAFSGCKLLKSVRIPSNLFELSYGLFSQCSSLRDVFNLNEVSHIGDYAFNECFKLKNFNLSNELLGIGESAFGFCKSIEKISIPNTVSKIEDFAFYNCTNLKSLVIPSGVKEIGVEAFAGCTNLIDLQMQGKPIVAENTFDGVPYEKEIYSSLNLKTVITPQNIKQHKDEIIDFIKDYFSDKIGTGLPRGHILPDGTYVSCFEQFDGFAPHRVSEKQLSIGLQNSGYAVRGFEFDGSLGNSIFDLLGCIRVNGDNEDYIALPKDKITIDQQESLEFWLNWYFYICNNNEIAVATVDGKQVYYNKKEYEPEDIVKKINRYYNTGNLYENKRRRQLK